MQHSEMQTQIGAKDMQIHLHNSGQSELCDVNSSWSAENPLSQRKQDYKRLRMTKNREKNTKCGQTTVTFICTTSNVAASLVS